MHVKQPLFSTEKETLWILETSIEIHAKKHASASRTFDKISKIEKYLEQKGTTTPH